MTTSDEFLHFGVKGMKWGVRKSEPWVSSTGVRSTKLKAKSMSDADLKTANKRMQLEQQYASLTKQTAVQSQGKEVTSAILKKTGQVALSIAIGTVSGYATGRGMAFLKKKLG